MATYGPYFAVVRSIHDGDTIGVDVDLGFDHFVLAGNPVTNKRSLSCRLWGINAPELSTDIGKEALAYLQSILQPGDSVNVLSHGWDKYGGRFDGEVFKAGSSVSVNRLMVEAGHAAQL